MVAASPDTPPPRPASAPVRRLGRFELLKLLGKSEGSMVWLVNDTRSSQQLMLVLPRTQPANAGGREHWQQAVRKAARINHPHLAHVVDLGEEEGRFQNHER